MNEPTHSTSIPDAPFGVVPVSWARPTPVVELAVPDGPVLRINDPQGAPLVTVHPDGRVEYGPDVDLDAAARTFWDTIGRWVPGIAWGPVAVQRRAVVAGRAYDATSRLPAAVND